MMPYRAIALAEAIEAAFGMLELVGGQLLLIDLGDDVPELLVLRLENDDHTGALRVEGAGDVFDGSGDELADAGVGDGGFVVEGVVGAAGLDRFHEGGFVC